MAKQKGETAMDVRRKVCTALEKFLVRDNEVHIKKFIALMVYETGYSKRFVTSAVDSMEESEIIFVRENGIATFTLEEKNRRGLKDNGKPEEVEPEN